jgi:predicted ATPase
MNKLDRIQIEGFKSIKQLDLHLGQLNVLIGANGAGKSNFISTFKLLNEMAELRLQLFVGSKADRFLRHGRRVTPRLSVALDFGANSYSFALTPSENQLVFESEVISFRGNLPEARRPLGAGQLESKLPDQLQDQRNARIASYVFPSIKGWRVYHFHDTSDQAALKRSGPVNDNASLRSDASNLAAFLYLLQQTHPQSYQRIRDTVRLVAPFFDDFSLRPDPLSINQQEIMLEWRECGSDFPFTAYQLSDGTLRFICLAVVLLQPSPPATIIIDEPELGLHPYAIEVLAGLLRSVSQRRQIIISTQSVPLVNQLDAEHLIVVNHVAGESQFVRPDPQNCKAGWKIIR